VKNAESHFLIYGLIVWGNTYPTSLQAIYILQKKAIRIITFSKFDDTTSPLFKRLNIIKFFDLIEYYISIFMFKYYNNLLPSSFDSFFTQVNQKHHYNTRAASKQSYYLPKVRTNFAKFNIRFQGATTWNSLDTQVKILSITKFKENLKQKFIDLYWATESSLVPYFNNKPDASCFYSTIAILHSLLRIIMSTILYNLIYVHFLSSFPFFSFFFSSPKVWLLIKTFLIYLFLSYFWILYPL